MIFLQKIAHTLSNRRKFVPKWRMHLVGLFMFCAGISFSLVYLTNTIILPNLFAATSPWTQTDWSGGTASGTVTGTVTTYESQSDIDTSTSGEISLAFGSEELSDIGFDSDSDLDSWLGVDPSSISGLQFHSSADSGVYTDAGSTAATDGQDVQQWNDQSGNDHNSSAPSSGRRPTYYDDQVNGRPSLEFVQASDTAGNDDALNADLTSVSSFTDVTVFSVASFDYSTQPSGNYDYIYSLYNPSTPTSLAGSISRFASSNLYYNYYGGSAYTGQAISTGFKLFSQQMTNSAPRHYFWVDRSAQTVQTIGSQNTITSPRLTLGKWANGTWALNGRISEFLLYDEVLDSNNRHAVENYLNNKYNLGTTTLTIDTTTKRTGAGSAKVVTVTNTAELLQQVNVGDTNTYLMEAYVYTDGSAVTSSDVELYSNGSTVSSTFTSAGSGWYQVTGTVTGAAASRDYGIQVKSGKTVYIDDMSLKNVPSSGTLTSNILNAEFAADWGALSYSTTGSGTVSVKVRTDSSSDMTGATAWGSCTAVSSGADLSSNGCVTDTDQYIQYQIVLSPSGGSSPVIEDLSIAFTASDQIAPTTNATSVSITSVTDGAWTNTEPTITWTAGADDGGGGGLLGYCISLDEATPGASDELDPELSADVLTGIDDGVSNSTCPYIVTGTSVDLSSISGLTLTTGQQYYFSIKAIDIAGNVWTGVANEFQDLVSFKYDATKPTNPSFMSLPSDFIATKEASLTWPTSGGDAPSDSNSGIAGLQYRIGTSGTWYGDNHTGDEDADDLLSNDGSYTFQLNPDFDNIDEGNNLVYLRTWDVAGNITSSYVSGVLKVNTVAPGVPQNLAVTPEDATTNSYAFSWDAPLSFTGSESNLTYCYTVNTVPTANTCAFTSAGQTSLSAGAYATQPGTNTMYIVAKDEASNVNYDTYSSVEFEYSGSAPGIPQSVDTADISIKAQSDWKLAVSWSEPTDTGAGISTYKVYRSTSATSCSSSFGSFSLIGSTAGTSYTDTGLSQDDYYYCVKACDSANNCGAVSSTVTGYPDGKFTTSADLTAEPTITSITTKKATITWSTDRTSDSKVAFGTSSGNYSSEEVSNSSQVTSHTINLTNLKAGTTYYFKAKWTDEDGNTGLSDEKSFTTDSAPSTKEASISNISISSALLTFTATGATQAKIYYGPTTTFGGLSEVSTSTTETTYTVPLSGLEDDTKYFYKINLLDSEGEEYQGEIDSFTTLPRPRISNVRIQEVRQAANPTVLVTWESNTDISTIVTYYPEGNPAAAIDNVDVARVTGTHRMLIRGLAANSVYTLITKGVDKVGNEAVSDSQRFTTSTDTRPPVISDLNVEGNVQVEQGGAGKSIQLIISWNTDEPSTSQVEFGEGTGVTYSQQTQEDKNLTANHVVIVSGLTPSKVYHFRAISKDGRGNTGKSIDTVTIAPKATDDALQLVLSNLKETFGFLDAFIK